MTKFYIVRHGQTDYNKKHRFQGRSDVPLNEVGVEQAKKIADSLADVDFGAIYYSPLIRAKQTADEIYKKHSGARYLETPEIAERDFGDYEGEPSDVKPLCHGLWNRHLAYGIIKNGETMEDMTFCCGRTKIRGEEELKSLTNRLNRIEGQIRGIKGMLEKDAYCADILTQSAAVCAAMNAFNRELLSNHLHTCVAEDIRAGKDETIDELLAILGKLMK